MGTTLIAVAFNTGASAQTFDILSSCDSGQALRAAVDHDPQECRQPRGALARAIAMRQPSSICFFKGAWPGLEEFECAQERGYPDIICFRPKAAGTIARIRNEYGSGVGTTIRSYLDSASDCSYSSGRASPAPANMITFGPLGWIAEAQLVLGVETGPRNKKSDGAILHGFGTTDPEIGGLSPEVEFVRAYSGTSRLPSNSSAVADDVTPDELERTTKLVLYRDNDEVLDEQFNGEMQRRGLALSISSAAFSIEPIPPDEIQSLSDVAAWRAAADESPRLLEEAVISISARIEQALSKEGFRALTGSEKEAFEGGLKNFNSQKTINKRYALRKVFSTPRFRPLIKLDNKGCFQDGAILILIASIGADINLISMGVANCMSDASEYLEIAEEEMTLDQTGGGAL